MATALYGVLGWPIGHSASPAMMKAAFLKLGLDAVYLPFAVEPSRIAHAVRGLEALGAVGVNVTIPHKQAVVSLTNQMSEEAKLAGAVNTLHFTESGIRGHNTDVGGWWTSVKDHVHPGQDIAVLGAGGAARAVLAALVLQMPSVKVRLVARDMEKNRSLAELFRDRMTIMETPWSARHAAIADAGLVVNTTPIGMWPNVEASPVDDDGCFARGKVVQDIVYRPRQTCFAKQAAGRGALVLDGLAMLIYQGAEALTFWTGHEAPALEMWGAAEAFLSSEGS